MKGLHPWARQWGKWALCLMIGCCWMVLLSACGGGGGAGGGGSTGVPISFLPGNNGVVSESVALVKVATVPGSVVQMNGQYMRGSGGVYSLSLSLMLGRNFFGVSVETPTGEKKDMSFVLNREFTFVYAARDLSDGRQHIFIDPAGENVRRVGPLSASGMVHSYPILGVGEETVMAVSQGPLGWSIVRFSLGRGEEEDGEEVLYGPDAQADQLAHLNLDRAGEHLIYLRRQGSNSIWYLLNLETGQSTPLLQETGITQPVFDPTGQFIYFLKTEGAGVSLMRKRVSGNFPGVVMGTFPGAGQMVCSLANSLVMVSVEPLDPEETVPVPDWRIRYFRYSDQSILADRTFVVDDQLLFGCHRLENVAYSGRLRVSNGVGVVDLTNVQSPGVGGSYDFRFSELGALYSDPSQLSF